jgi:hypothetical protein
MNRPRALVFLVAGKVGDSADWDACYGEPASPLMGWQEIRRLARDGLYIGSHGLTHRRLDSLAIGETIEECTSRNYPWRCLTSDTNVRRLPPARFCDAIGGCHCRKNRLNLKCMRQMLPTLLEREENGK